MSPAPRHGLIESPVLDGAERTALEGLVEVCNRYEGLDLPLGLGESAVQLGYYKAGVLLGYIELQDHAPKQVDFIR